ncbi:hypothetical protein NL676_029971 [Syzygium grande]|nr:hypothetical protein NL676_029971 [Syzygium grande]
MHRTRSRTGEALPLAHDLSKAHDLLSHDLNILKVPNAELFISATDLPLDKNSRGEEPLPPVMNPTMNMSC